MNLYRYIFQSTNSVQLTPIFHICIASGALPRINDEYECHIFGACLPKVVSILIPFKWLLVDNMLFPFKQKGKQGLNLLS